MHIEFTVYNLVQLEKDLPSNNFKTIHYVKSSKEGMGKNTWHLLGCN